MNNIGLLIKMARIQQNMKQVSLAKGICSTSYLSKIENNQTIPSEDVLQLLLERLELDYEDLSTEQELKFLSELYLLYKEAIIERNKSEITERLTTYNKRNFLFVDESNFFTYNLYLFRLSLITEADVNKVKNLMNALDQMQEKFDERQHFIFNKNCGFYYYLVRDYKLSLSYFESALEYVTNFHLQEWEFADFYHALSMSYLSNNHLLNTIEYSTKSLKFYKDNLIFNRAIDCYIVIGIAYKLNLNFKNAEESFLLAKKIVINFKLSEYTEIINHNLGSLFAIQGQSKIAIDYFKESLKNSSGDENYLLTIYSIAKEYSKQNDDLMVLQWTNTGLEYISKLLDNDYLSYFYHFNIYKLLHNKDLEFESILVNAIDYFESNNEFHYVYKYSILLGNKYSEIRKYKNSTLYLQKAISFSYKIKSINYWEDL
jgi:transcriptional regulator with XRE-family HTH domain